MQRSIMRPSVVLSLILGVALQAAAAPIQFRLPISIGLEALPETIAVGDLNADDRADIVVTHYLEGTITVLLGTGQSSFTPAGEFPIRVGGIRACIRDLDNDAKPDLIISHDESDNVSLLRGNGDGTFQDAQSIDPGHDPVGVAIADLDDDELLDLVVALSDESGGQIGVMRNLGDMQFERIQLFAIGGDAVEVVVDDFDGDGFPDAAVSNPEGEGLTRLRGIAGGMFEVAGEIQVRPGTTLLALADVDSDGDNDLIAGVTDSSVIGVVRSAGGGTFEPVEVYPSGGSALNGMVAADVNGDGVPDVTSSHLRSKNAAVILGRGDGTFAEAIAVTSGSNPVEVGVADFNSDGLFDIVSAVEGVDSAVPSLNLLLGDGSGGFRAPEQLLGAARPVGVAVGDFNGDAIADAVVGSETMRGLVVLPGAHGALSTASVFVPLDREPDQVMATDFDADGWTDVVALSAAEVSVLFADGAGALSAPMRLPLPAAAGALTLGDIDGDGDPDIVASAARAPAAFYFVRNDGNRAFAAAATLGSTIQPSAIASADLNGDGRADLVANDLQSRLFLFSGPALESLGSLTIQGIASAIAVGDVDASGAADIVAVSPTGRRLSTFLNNGSGVLAPAAPQTAGFASAVALRDLDGDGHAEAIAADQLSGEIMVFQNAGAGGWIALDPMVGGERLASLSAADFNDDGRYDLLASGTSVCRLINETASPTVVRGDGNGDGAISVADFTAAVSELFDGDGEQVESIALGTFAATAGVDNDGDGVVTRADLRTLLLRLLPLS